MKTQKQIILEVLQSRPGQWVPMPYLVRECRRQGNSEAYAVHSRAADLRKDGHNVQNKVVHQQGRQKSYYRLVEAELTETA